jgi:hypothetical protein
LTLRQITAELVFGQIKHTRGLRQALHCGREKVNSLWQFDCAIHNLLKIHRPACKDRAPAVA